MLDFKAAIFDLDIISELNNRATIFLGFAENPPYLF